MQYPLTLLYDGACPVCRFEMDRLRSRDGLRRLAFVDISAPGFRPQDHAPAACLDAMRAAIHGVLPDGTVVTGVETLRLAYGAVGLGAWFLPSRLPGLSRLAEKLYLAFARNRYAISRLAAPWLPPPCEGGTCDRRTS